MLNLFCSSISFRRVHFHRPLSLPLLFWLPCPLLSSCPLPHASSQSGGCPLASPFHQPAKRLCPAAAWTLHVWQWGRPCRTSSGCSTRRTWLRRTRCRWAGTSSNWAASVSRPTIPAWPWAASASSKLWPRSLSNVRDICCSRLWSLQINAALLLWRSLSCNYLCRYIYFLQKNVS